MKSKRRTKCPACKAEHLREEMDRTSQVNPRFPPRNRVSYANSRALDRALEQRAGSPLLCPKHTRAFGGKEV